MSVSAKVDQEQRCHRGTSNTTGVYWPLWAACLLGYAAIGMTIQVIPAYTRDYIGAGTVAAGIAVTIGSLATMVTRPVAGRLSDQYGARPVVLAGAVMGSAGGLAHLVATDIPLLIGARLILGAGEGALFTAALGWVLSDADAAHRGKVAGHFGLSMWTGLAGGPVLGAVLLATAGYRAVWLAASFLPVVAWLLLIRTPRGSSRPSGDKSAHRALFPRAAWLPGVSIAFASIGYGIIAAFIVSRFVALGIPGQEFALATFGVAFMVARFFGSPFVDRIGPALMSVLALSIEAGGLLGLFLANAAPLVFLCTALTGVGISMLYPCLASIVAETANPYERTAALGAMTSAWDLGLAIGGPLGGLVAGTTSAPPFAVGAIAALIAIIPLIGQLRARQIR